MRQTALKKGAEFKSTRHQLLLGSKLANCTKTATPTTNYNYLHISKSLTPSPPKHPATPQKPPKLPKPSKPDPTDTETETETDSGENRLIPNQNSPPNPFNLTQKFTKRPKSTKNLQKNPKKPKIAKNFPI
jgi:hypothetical protein